MAIESVTGTRAKAMGRRARGRRRRPQYVRKCARREFSFGNAAVGWWKAAEDRRYRNAVDQRTLPIGMTLDSLTPRHRSENRIKVKMGKLYTVFLILQNLIIKRL